MAQPRKPRSPSEPPGWLRSAAGWSWRLLLVAALIYVVLNQDNVVRELKLSRDLSSARTVRDITRKEFDVPTTIARSGGRNYVVNAKFSTPAIPTTPYEVVKVPRK